MKYIITLTSFIFILSGCTHENKGGPIPPTAIPILNNQQMVSPAPEV